jgi:hypothetical protein
MGSHCPTLSGSQDQLVSTHGSSRQEYFYLLNRQLGKIGPIARPGRSLSRDLKRHILKQENIGFPPKCPIAPAVASKIHYRSPSTERSPPSRGSFCMRTPAVRSQRPPDRCGTLRNRSTDTHQQPGDTRNGCDSQIIVSSRNDSGLVLARRMREVRSGVGRRCPRLGDSGAKRGFRKQDCGILRAP